MLVEDLITTNWQEVVDLSTVRLGVRHTEAKYWFKRHAGRFPMEWELDTILAAIPSHHTQTPLQASTAQP